MRCGLVSLSLLLVVTSGCGVGGPAEAPPGVAQSPGGLKRITMALPGERDLAHHLGMGRATLRALVNPGLSVVDEKGVRRPALAETIPTLENGFWTTFPDGRMETTWTIRQGVRWHDGAPFTTDDLLFTVLVGRDREVPILNCPAYGSLEQITALDERTLTITWKEPYIFADRVFSDGVTLPLPRHRLEGQFLESREDFPRLTFWLYDYLGTGPYRVRSWDPSSMAVLEANSDYVLGRPKVDEIEVRFIPDGNTLTAGVLSGAIDMAEALGSIDRAIAIRDRWQDGRVHIRFEGSQWIAMSPQFVNSRPAIIAEVRFRRALLHAINRQDMADTLQAGVAPVAHSFLSPGQGEYGEIEARLPRYDYDPRQATQMIEALGYTRGADGVLRDGADQRLEVEIRSGPQDQAFNPAVAIADYWQRIGVQTSTFRATGRLAQDPELGASFPGFSIYGGVHDVVGLRVLHSAQARLPENGFEVGGAINRSRYMNPELDGLIDTYFRTISPRERVPIMGRIAQHVAEQLPVMGIYYNPDPYARANRLVNVSSKPAQRSNSAWNAHEWDVR